MDQTRIEKEMRELEGLIEFKFKDILWLSKAMYAKRIVVPGEGKNHREYANDSLATVGDTLLKFVLADKLYQEGKHIRGVITSEKSDTENKVVLNSTTCIIRGMPMRSLIFDPDVFIDRMDFDLDGFHFDTPS